MVSLELPWGCWTHFFDAALTVIHAHYFGRDHIGAISAMSWAIALPICGSGPFLVGLSRDIYKSYSPIYIFVLIFLAIASTSLFFAVPPKATTGNSGNSQKTSYKVISESPGDESPPHQGKTIIGKLLTEKQEDGVLTVLQKHIGAESDDEDAII